MTQRFQSVRSQSSIRQDALMYSHKDLLLHSIRDILHTDVAQNTLLPFLKYIFSSVVTPSGALRDF